MPSVPSILRPLPVEGRRDLTAVATVFQGVTWWVVKDPISLLYHRLREDEYEILKLLDGRRSLEELRAELRRRCPASRVSLRELQRFVTGLHDLGLARSSRMGTGVSLERDARTERRRLWLQKLGNPLALQFPGIDPQPLLDRLLPIFGWMFHPVAIVALLAAVGAAMGWLLIHFDEFRRQLPEYRQFFGWPNLIWMWAVLGGSKIFHELGHGLACRRFRSECHTMGLMFLVFCPCLYCDVTDSWMLPNKWQRIVIAAAGMYFEAILSAVAVLIWWNTSEGLIHHLCLNLFFVTSVSTVLFNANPLMQFDGYYILSDWLEIPNLRAQSQQMLRDRFGAFCLGIEPRPDPFAPQRGSWLLLLFAVSTWLYRGVVLFGVVYLLCTVLKPYGLQSVGVTAAVLSIAAMLAGAGKSIYQMCSAPREEPMNRFRAAVSLTAACGILLLVAFVPLPLWIEADFTIEPEEVRHVYTTVPGRLADIRTSAGAAVRKGDVLAVLVNEEKEDKRRDLLVELELQEKARLTQRALGDSRQRALVEARIENLVHQIQDLDSQLAQLVLRAPCDGTVVAPEVVPEASRDASADSLQRWYGTPLEPQNIGCWLEIRTHLLSVAPNNRSHAVLLVAQEHRDELRPGSPVSLKVEHRPGVTLSGTIREISGREDQYAPPELSSNLGAALSTTTDTAGRERLTSAAYRAIVPLESVTSAVRTGLRGKARLWRPRTAAAWLWRWGRQTLHFRL